MASEQSILVIEDDANLRGALHMALEHAGFAVTDAADGDDAVKLQETTKFDLIMLDLIMPRMNGFEFLKRFRENDTETPVLIVTNSGASKELEEVTAMGATKTLIKVETPIERIIMTAREMLSTAGGAA